MHLPQIDRSWTARIGGATVAAPAAAEAEEQETCVMAEALDLRSACVLVHVHALH